MGSHESYEIAEYLKIYNWMTDKGKTRYEQINYKQKFIENSLKMSPWDNFLIAVPHGDNFRHYKDVIISVWAKSSLNLP